MTTAEYVKELLDLAMQTHGEDAPVKQLGGGITAARPPTYRNVLQYGVTPFFARNDRS